MPICAQEALEAEWWARCTPPAADTPGRSWYPTFLGPFMAHHFSGQLRAIEERSGN